MKIIVVCQYYWPDNFLINDICEEFVKKGNQVTVLTGLPDYTTTKVPKEYKFFKRRKEVHNGVEIIRVPIIARHHGFLCRVINYLSFFINASIYAHFMKIDADVILSYQLAPVLMVNPSIILKKKLKIPMFLYVLDIWPDQMKIWNVRENNPIYKLVLKYCKYAYGSGDVVGITSKPFRDYLINVCNVNKNKIEYLPQHSDKMHIEGNNDENNDNDETNLIFAGNIGQQQNLECLLKAVQLMKTNKKFLIHIYGNGTSFEKCKDLANEFNINDRVIFYGRVPKEKLNEVYPKMDAFLLTLCSEKEIGFVANTVPAKLQGYMSAGKPIIASIDGGASDIIKESNCGIVVPSGDYKEFAKALDEFVENKNNYSNCGKNAIEYFEKNFEKSIVLDKFENCLKKLISKNKDCGVKNG